MAVILTQTLRPGRGGLGGVAGAVRQVPPLIGSPMLFFIPVMTGFSSKTHGEKIAHRGYQGAVEGHGPNRAAEVTMLICVQGFSP